ncbi:MAG: chitobiase/beta-hexosaminidase C-terminal domain-containing protein [Lachnospiraceae bacterium]|nr:chitobiase/beta-hexosaminidase C-terminal domain-containing protein [Lachnospiraceae bacterium]
MSHSRAKRGVVRFLGLVFACALLISTMLPAEKVSAAATDLINFTYYNPVTKQNETKAKANVKYLGNGSIYEISNKKYKGYWQDPLDGEIAWYNWYVVDEDITIDTRCKVYGEDINLLLLDGHTLTCNEGIEVPTGSKLTIWAATDDSSAGVKGTGELIIHAHGKDSALGGSKGVDAGTIVINGGTITADSEKGTCIGAAYGSANGSIIINRGMVTASSAEDTGIGGSNSKGGYVTINGGTVTAKSLISAGSSIFSAGIGCSYGGSQCRITINGGTVTANGAFQGPGIGGDDCTITINGGNVTAIGGERGAGIGARQRGETTTVTINGGSVTATGGLLGAGIGGGFEADGGNITITGGTVIASATCSEDPTINQHGAGIGGGGGDKLGAHGGRIIITGGNVTATGARGAAGIGGGRGIQDSELGNSGKITIIGGTITANGGERGAGIGGGYKGHGEEIIIANATVTAIGGSYAAGIGGGYNGNAGTITILGGTIESTGGKEGTGIGAGYDGDGGNISIKGGRVMATGGQGGAGIGTGTSGELGTISISGGQVMAQGNDSSYWAKGIVGNTTLSYIESSRATISLSSNSFVGSVTIDDGCYFTDGSRVFMGSLSDYDRELLGGTTLCGGNYANYLDEKGKQQGAVECTNVSSDMTVLSDVGATNGWYVVRDNVLLENLLTISGDIRLILADGARLTANQGINVNEGNALTVYSQSDGEHMGELIAHGGYRQAAIGSNESNPAGRIMLAGGEISAYGGEQAAGIGSARSYAGKIRITGCAKIKEAIAGTQSDGNGIGVGYGSFFTSTRDNNVITIDGGIIEGVSQIGGYYCQITLDYDDSGKIPALPQVKFDAFQGYVTLAKSFVSESLVGEKEVIMPAHTYLNQEGYVYELYDWLPGVAWHPGKGYAVNVDENIVNGQINIENSYHAAQEGDTVTLTALSAKGCYLTELKVTDQDGNELILGGTGDQRTFQMPASSVNITATFGTDGVFYLDPTKSEKERIQTCDKFTMITDQQTLKTGWYVVDGEISLEGYGSRLVIEGDVNLILLDGSKLRAMRGINVTYENRLTIWAQSEGEQMGQLVANAEESSELEAGIGSGEYIETGYITINGGKIEAIGHKMAAGIGGGFMVTGGHITINGGDITAKGGSLPEQGAGGAGIGGGYECMGTENIIINGGKILAVGGTNASGIGSGSGTNVHNYETGSITINGGEITSISGADNAAIGRAHLLLTIYDNANVTAGEDAMSAISVPSDYQMDACYSYPYVKIEKLPFLIKASAVSGKVMTDHVGGASAGEIVTVTLTPDENCSLSSVIVKQGENLISTKKKDQATYVFTMPKGDVSVEAIFKKVIAPEVSIKGWTYGGYDAGVNAPTITDAGSTGEADFTYYYKAQNAPEDAYVMVLPTRVGVYNLKAVIAETDKQLSAVAETSFEITAKALTITADSAQRAYNGEALTAGGYTHTELAKGDAIAEVAIQGSQTEVGDCENIPSSVIIKNGLINVTGNYAITYVSGTLSVTKIAQSAPNAPVVVGVTASGVELVSEDGFEYSINQADWQTNGVFTGLLANSEYQFWQRRAGNDYYEVSPSSPSTKVTTLDNQVVIFRVAEGYWNNGSNEDIVVELVGQTGKIKLSADQIPAVGNIPATGRKIGAWDMMPDTETIITNTTVYTYTYGLTAYGQIQAKAILSGREWKDEDAFMLTVTPVGNAPATETASVIVTKNSTGFTESFGKMTFTEPGTYQYMVSLTHRGEVINGISYDSADRLLTFEVKDDGNGNLSVGGTEPVQTAEFESTYGVTGTAQLKAMVNLSGRVWTEGDAYEIIVTSVGDAPAFPVSSVTVTKASTDHTECFGTVTFTRAGVYTYKISETHQGEEIDGVTYDAMTHEITYTVTDDGNGNLVGAGNSLVQTAEISNVYEASCNVALGARLSENAELGDQEFTIELLRNGYVAETKSVKQSETVTFTEIGFTLEDLGKTYEYEIRQTIPEGAVNLSGMAVKDFILYDTGIKKISVTLSDNGDGTLSASVQGEALFTNAVATLGTPVLSLTSGTYTGKQTVVISCASVNATIYYTMDGSAPSATNGSVYNGPITFDDSTTLKAIALMEYYKDSVIAEATYTIVRPKATITNDPSANKRLYDGTEQPLLHMDGTAVDGMLYYAIGSKETEPGEDAPGTPEGDRNWKVTIPAASDAGTYYVWVKAVGKTGYDNSDAKCIASRICYPVTFRVVNGAWDDETTEDKTMDLSRYADEDLALMITASDIPGVGTKPEQGYKAGTWKKDGKDITMPPDMAITGATTFVYTYAEKKLASVTKTPTAKNLTYDGSLQELVQAGTVANGEMVYALGTATQATGSFENTIPTGNTAGTYYVWFKAQGDSEHGDSDPACVQVDIARRPVTFYGRSETKHYIGSVIEINTVDITGLVNGHTHNVTFSAKGMEVSSQPYEGTITEKSDVVIWDDENNPVHLNYDITVVNGGLTIAVSDDELTVAMQNATFVYDSAAHSLQSASTSAASGETVIKYSKDQTFWTDDVSTLTATNVADSMMVYVRATNPNYAGTAKSSAILTIAPRAVTVIASAQTIKENESIQNSIKWATMTDALSGHTLDAITLTLENGKIVPSGANICDVKGKDVTSNYDIEYLAGDLILELQGEIKTHANFTGRAWANDDSFEFTISATDGTPMPSKTSVTITKNSTDKTESFGEILFTKAGEYTYTITQTHKGESIDGVSYDSTDKTVTIKVKKDDNGKLVADGTALVQTAEFTNAYRATGSVTISTSVAANADLGNREFTFQLLDKNDNVLQTGSTTKQGETGSFYTLDYDLDDAGKTITYKIQQVIPEGAEGKGNNKYEKDGVIYDGEVKEVTVTVSNDKGDGTLDVSCSGSATTFTNETSVKSYSVNVVGGSANVSYATDGSTITITASQPAAGKAFVQWSCSDSSVVFDNPSSTVTTFTMPKSDVTITAVCADIDIEGINEGGYTYTGQAIEPAIIVSLIGVDWELVKGRDYEVTYQKNEDVGQATLTVTMKAPHAGSKSATFEIKPKAVTITAKSEQFTYDGMAHSSAGYDVNGLVGADAVTAVVTGSITFPSEGPVENKIDSYQFTSGSASNYNVTTVNGALTMVNTSNAITITAASEEWTYDGTAHANNAVTVTSGTLLTGDTLVATATGSVTNVVDTAVGNNPVAAGYKVMHGTEDVTANYVITTQAGTLTVTTALVEITAKSDQFTYDGTSHGNAGYDVDGLVGADAVTAVVTGSIMFTSEGTVVNQLTSYQFTKGDARNYCVTTTNGTLTMSNASQAITITAASDAWTYDASAHTNNEVTLTSGTLFTGDTLVATATGSVTNVVDTTVGNNPVATGYKVMHGTEDVTASYVITAQAGTLTVNPRLISVVAHPAMKEFEAKDPEFKYTVVGLLGSDGMTGALSREPGEKAGKYEIVLGTLTAGSNYAINYTGSTLTILKEDYLNELRRLLTYAIALGGNQTVTWEKGTALPYDVMKTLQDHPQLTLIFKYYYGNMSYEVTIHGKDVVIDPKITWYGPMNLYGRYGLKIGFINPTGVTGSYVVVRGDNLTKVARRLNTSVDWLVKVNMIKNPNLIWAKQVLKY